MNNFLVGLAIRTARSALHMSQGQLADILGVSQSTISNIENGIDIPGGELLQQIEQVLGMNGQSGNTGNGRSTGRRRTGPTYQTNINIKVASDNNTGTGNEKKKAEKKQETNQNERQESPEEKPDPEDTGEETLQQRFDAAAVKKKDSKKTELPPDLDNRRTAMIKQLRKNAASLNRMNETEFREFLKSTITLERYLVETERPNIALKTILKDI